MDVLPGSKNSGHKCPVLLESNTTALQRLRRWSWEPSFTWGGVSSIPLWACGVGFDLHTTYCVPQERTLLQSSVDEVVASYLGKSCVPPRTLSFLDKFKGIVPFTPYTVFNWLTIEKCFGIWDSWVLRVRNKVSPPALSRCILYKNYTYLRYILSLDTCINPQYHSHDQCKSIFISAHIPETINQILQGTKAREIYAENMVYADEWHWQEGVKEGGAKEK